MVLFTLVKTLIRFNQTLISLAHWDYEDLQLRVTVNFSEVAGLQHLQSLDTPKAVTMKLEAQVPEQEVISTASSDTHSSTVITSAVLPTWHAFSLGSVGWKLICNVEFGVLGMGMGMEMALRMEERGFDYVLEFRCWGWGWR
jgi:hypothetical protein